MTTPTLIENSDQLTAQWIQSVLQHAGHDVQVSDVWATPIGAGNVSDLLHVDIAYIDGLASGPEAVVVKLRPSTPELHAHGLNSGAYHREIGGYRAVTERAACRIPGMFHVAGDETNINLVLEDLTSSTAPGDQIAGCSPDEAHAVVTEFARLHSRFFPLADADSPRWMIRLPEVCDYWSDAAAHGASKCPDRFAGHLGDEALAVIAEAATIVREWHLLPQRHLTMTHGDPRVDNILFEQLPDGSTGAVLLDWQVTGLRNPMYDVGYFVSGSLSVEDRRRHEQSLLTHYAAVFAEDTDGYDLATATADFQVQILSGLFITLAATHVLPDPAVDPLLIALLERNCAAVLDWHSVEAVRNVTGALALARPDTARRA